MKRFVILILVCLMLGGCFSFSVNNTLEENKNKIKTIAVLPLFNGCRSGETVLFSNEKDNEIFIDYANTHLTPGFENLVYFRKDIRVLLPRRDFFNTYSHDVDFQVVASELGVDGVIAVYLTDYLEVNKGVIATYKKGKALLETFTDSKVDDLNAYASFSIYFSYLGLEEITYNLNSEINTAISATEQKKLHLMNLFEWLNRKFPLCIYYSHYSNSVFNY